MQPSIISSRVTGVLAALLVILVFTFVASVRGAARLPELDAAVTHARDLLDEVGVTRSTLREVEWARRGYFLSHANDFLEMYLAATKDAVAHLEHLRELTVDDPAQRRRVDAIGPLVARELALVTAAVAPSSERAPDAAAASEVPDEGAIVSEQIRGLVGELDEDARARLHEYETEASSRTVKVIRGFGGVALLGLLLLGAASYILDRDAAVHAAVLEELRRHTRARDTRAAAAPEIEISPPADDRTPSA